MKVITPKIGLCPNCHKFGGLCSCGHNYGFITGAELRRYRAQLEQEKRDIFPHLPLQLLRDIAINWKSGVGPIKGKLTNGLTVNLDKVSKWYDNLTPQEQSLLNL